MAGSVTITRGFSVGSDTNWIFWDVDFRHIQKSDSYQVWRKAGTVDYELLYTSAPIPDTQGVNPYVDYAKRYYQDTDVQNGVTYTYQVRVKTLLGEYGPYSPELSVLCEGNKYYVSHSGTDTPVAGNLTNPYATMAYALSQVTAGQGNVIYYVGGESEPVTYTQAETFSVGDGISIRGKDKVLVEQTSTYNSAWWDDARALFKWESSAPGSAANVEVSNLSFTSATNAWGSIYLKNKAGWVVHSITATDLWRSCLFTQSNTEDFALFNCDLQDCGQETESFSAGNYSMKGNVRNGTIHEMKLKGLKKGYCAKLYFAYETPANDVVNVHVFRCDYDTKDWSLFSSEYNITHENYTIRNKWFIFSNNRLRMSSSCDKNNETIAEADGDLATYFHHNTYVVKKSTLQETASSYTLDEDTLFDNRTNSKPWGGSGEFNTGVALRNKTYRRCVWLNAPGVLFVYTCHVENHVMEYCTVQSPGRVTLFQWRRANSDGTKQGFVLRKNIFDCVGGLNMHDVLEGASLANVPTYSDTRDNIIRGSVTLSGVAPLHVSTLAGSTPELARTGSVPYPYYQQMAGGNADGLGAFAEQEVVLPNENPVVAITSPPTGVGYPVGTTVTIAYTATDTDGSIGLRELLVDGSVVASATQGNTFTYPLSATGVRSFAVRVTDNSGAVSTSTDILIGATAVVVPPPPPPLPLQSAAKSRLKLYRTRKEVKLVLLTK